ncbi:MAG: ABC transporter ATP-binding protein [Pseudomonadota bacterium]
MPSTPRTAEVSALALLSIKDLAVTFRTEDGPVEAVRGVSLEVHPGESVAVVGESGSGKSQIMMATMGLLASNGGATGSVQFGDKELLGLSQHQLNRIRGAKITMIFQEPMTSLDPLHTIGRQIAEPLMVHKSLSERAARRRVVELLHLVQLPDAEDRVSAYPHELSGGQRQRVMIAMALANDPEILIADEPTTALDVTIQAEILALLADLQTRLGMAIVFITHDLGIVEAFCDRVYVLRGGEVVESGPTARIFASPQEDYTKMLLSAEPEGRKDAVDPASPVLLTADAVHVDFTVPGSLFRRPAHTVHAVRDVRLSLQQGQTLGIVGESGSGKSTLGRVLVQLLPGTGRVVFEGEVISDLSRGDLQPVRRALQMVFQDPYGSLSPRMTVGEIIAEGLRVHEPQLSSAERMVRTDAALAEVGLEPGWRNRFPHEFSGGQRQRIAIARSLILRPKVIVLDEPTSALDRSVQKQIVALLRTLQAERGLSYVFISHDLAVIRALADTVMVMRDGAIVEHGPTDAIFDNPSTDYTRALMRAAFALKEVLLARTAAEEARAEAG